MRNLPFLLLLFAETPAIAAPTVLVVPVPAVESGSLPACSLRLGNTDDLQLIEIRILPGAACRLMPAPDSRILRLPEQSLANGEHRAAVLFRQSEPGDIDLFRLEGVVHPGEIVLTGVTRSLERIRLVLREENSSGADLSEPSIGEIRIFPNPSAGRAQVQLQLSSPAWVSLRVLDVAGRRVREIPPVWLSAGSHVETWDGRSADGNPVPSGVYFIDVRTGRERRLERLLVTR